MTAAERVWNRLDEIRISFLDTGSGKKRTGFKPLDLERLCEEEGISFDDYADYHRDRMKGEE